MAENKNYYDVLGLSKSASAEDIKQAYKKLAKEHHPDVAKDKANAEKKFKEINEAYQVLSDPQKKQMYDTYGTANPQGGFGGGQGPFGGFSGSGGQWGPFSYSYSSNGGAQGFGDVDPMDIFEQVFGFRDFGGRRPRKGRDLHYSMRVSFADAVKGLEEEVSINGKKLKVKIPAGIRDENRMKFEGQGDPAQDKNLPNGDLILEIHVTPHKVFQRYDDDIYIAKDITFVDAALGAEIEIPVVDPSALNAESVTKLKIPSGTQAETQFRVKGKGMPRLRDSSRGDMFVQVRITIPTKLSKDQKKLLEEYRKL
jgi:molecular chaperone DnaJ